MQNYYLTQLNYSSFLESTETNTENILSPVQPCEGGGYKTVSGIVSMTGFTNNSTAQGNENKCIECGAKGDAYFGAALYCSPCALKLQKEGKI
tara:strand:- start:574 stop:852 length:279 start_codon:yes stop_codon:yes gene_type:complete